MTDKAEPLKEIIWGVLRNGSNRCKKKKEIQIEKLYNLLYVKEGQSLIFRLIILNEISRTQRFYFTSFFFFLLVFAPNDLKRCNYKTNIENRLEFRSPNTPLEPRTSAWHSARDASPSSAKRD